MTKIHTMSDNSSDSGLESGSGTSSSKLGTNSSDFSFATESNDVSLGSGGITTPSSGSSEINTASTSSERASTTSLSSDIMDVEITSTVQLQGTDNEARRGPDEDIDYAVRVTIGDVRDVFGSLSAICFKEIATIYFTKEGMRATVDDSKCFEGTAIIPASVFQEYEVAENFIGFQVNYRAFVNCINIYGKTGPDARSTCRMFYAGEGCPVKMFVEYDGALTECTLQTLDVEKPVLDFHLCPRNYISRVIVKAKFLKSAWHDLDFTRDDLVLWITNKEPYIQLESESHFAKTTITIPKDSEAVEFFECLESRKTTYHMSFIRPTLRAFHISTSVSLRTNEQGFLFLQFLVRTVNGHSCFVDFICHPNEDDDDVLNLSDTSSI